MHAPAAAGVCVDVEEEMCVDVEAEEMKARAVLRSKNWSKPTMVGRARRAAPRKLTARQMLKKSKFFFPTIQRTGSTPRGRRSDAAAERLFRRGIEISSSR